MDQQFYVTPQQVFDSYEVHKHYMFQIEEVKSKSNKYGYSYLNLIFVFADGRRLKNFQILLNPHILSSGLFPSTFNENNFCFYLAKPVMPLFTGNVLVPESKISETTQQMEANIEALLLIEKCANTILKEKMTTDYTFKSCLKDSTSLLLQLKSQNVTRSDSNDDQFMREQKNKWLGNVIFKQFKPVLSTIVDGEITEPKINHDGTKFTPELHLVTASNAKHFVTYRSIVQCLLRIDSIMVSKQNKCKLHLTTLNVCVKQHPSPFELEKKKAIIVGNDIKQNMSSFG